jgi:hypothetical protein
MRKFLWFLLPLALAACASPPREPASPAAPPAAAAPAVPAEEGEPWRVTGSHLEVRVYRDGPMQKLGHDHLVTSGSLAGEISLREPIAASRFTLRLPLASLVVDDPAARAHAGGEFAAPVPEKDREATRHNMLGERVLDAARQAELVLTSESIAGGPADFAARVRVSPSTWSRCHSPQRSRTASWSCTRFCTWRTPTSASSHSPSRSAH